MTQLFVGARIYREASYSHTQYARSHFATVARKRTKWLASFVLKSQLFYSQYCIYRRRQNAAIASRKQSISFSHLFSYSSENPGRLTVPPARYSRIGY